MSLVVVLLAIIAFGEACDKSTLFGKPVQLRTENHNVVIHALNCSVPVGVIGGDKVQIQIREYNIPKLFKGAIHNLPDVKVLQIEDNGIEEVESGAFENLPTAYNISLANNRIRSLPERVFENVGVKILHLEHNHISNISPKAFDNLPDLQTISLNHNELTAWVPFEFTATPIITSIYLSHNLLREIPENAFEHFAQQERNLQGIHLGSNRLQRVHERAFFGFDHVIILHLDNNELSQVSFDGQLRFDYLFLQNNRIRCLPDKIVKQVGNYLNLGENPLDCDCIHLIEQKKMDQGISIKYNQCNK